MTEYSQDFFKQLQRLIDKSQQGFHKCRDCGVVDGGRRANRKGDLGKIKAIVRLALVDPKGPPNEVNNVDFFCTKCRRPPPS